MDAQNKYEGGYMEKVNTLTLRVIKQNGDIEVLENITSAIWYLHKKTLVVGSDFQFQNIITIRNIAEVKILKQEAQ